MPEYPEHAATGSDHAPETRDVEDLEAAADGGRDGDEEPDRPAVTATGTGASGTSAEAAAASAAKADVSDRALRVAPRELLKPVPTTSRPSPPLAPGRGRGRSRGDPVPGRHGLLPATAEAGRQSDDAGGTVPPDLRIVQDLFTALHGDESSWATATCRSNLQPKISATCRSHLQPRISSSIFQ